MRCKTNSYFAAIDIAKIVLAVLVVTIHTHLFPEVLNPLARTAVPLFFMFSAFFFFCGDRNIKKVWVRNLRLYGIWFLILLPITLKIRGYFAFGFLRGILTLLHNFIFYSTFRSSWYIIALCIALTLVHLASRIMSNKVLLMISIPIYLLYCLFSNYYNLLGEFEWWVVFCNKYQKIFVTLCNNFPVAFIWLVLGKMFAEKEISIPMTSSWVLLLTSSILLIAEHIIVLNYELAAATDCYIFLIPVCTSVFSLLHQAECTLSEAPLLRKMSTITYVLHSSAIVLVDVIAVKLLHFSGSVLALCEFFGSISISIAATLVLMYLNGYRVFKWLKWAF